MREDNLPGPAIPPSSRRLLIAFVLVEAIVIAVVVIVFLARS